LTKQDPDRVDIVISYYTKVNFCQIFSSYYMLFAVTNSGISLLF